MRTLLNPDEEKAQEAADQLSEDPTAETWKDVTKELSTEEATKDLGGLRQGVAQGQNEPALDEAIFAAETGEVVGPIETEAGFYVLQVETINPGRDAAARRGDDARRSASSSSRRSSRQAVTDFQDAFVAKWRARTVCSDDLLADDEDGTVQTQLAERCSNFSVTDDGCIGDDEDDELQPDPVTGEQQSEPTGCGAFVPSAPGDPAATLAPAGRAIRPALAASTPGAAAAAGRPAAARG